METMDIVTSLLIGLFAGVWTAFLQCLFRRANLKHIFSRLLLYSLLPPIFWYLFAFGIIMISQKANHSMPDWVGMQVLMSGFNVFLISIAGTAMIEITAIRKTVYVFAVLLLSISIQVVLMHL